MCVCAWIHMQPVLFQQIALSHHQLTRGRLSRLFMKMPTFCKHGIGETWFSTVASVCTASTLQQRG